jgi:hypothetical protein
MTNSIQKTEIPVPEASPPTRTRPTHDAPKRWKKNFRTKSLESFKALLDPEKIVHEDAKAGAEFLGSLPDDTLADIFYALMVRRVAPVSLAASIMDTGLSTVYEGHLTAILRRLSLAAVPVLRSLDAGTVRKPSNPVLKMKIAPGSTSLHEHLIEAATADKNIDGVARMAGLASLLWRQLETMYAHPAREVNPFMMLAQVNSSAGLCMAALEKLHRMQMDVGIVQRVPGSTDVDLPTIGAFQTYIGELDNDSKEEMLGFTAAFRDFVKSKREEADRADAAAG